MAVALWSAGSWLGLVYAGAAAASWLYHWHDEQRFKRLDYALAWTAIGANCWMAWHTRDVGSTLVGVALVVAAVTRYFAAHAGDYHRHHTMWHLLCGSAGMALAQGYVGGAS